MNKKYNYWTTEKLGGYLNKAPRSINRYCSHNLFDGVVKIGHNNFIPYELNKQIINTIKTQGKYFKVELYLCKQFKQEQNR